MSDDQNVWQELQSTLPESAVEWRVQKSGMSGDRPWARVVPYPDARWLMDRLDQVLGPHNWRTDFIAGPAGGVICSLALRVDGEWIAKEDGAENTKIESVKGGLTDAFKRVCVQWNVGGIRSLYRVGDCWAQFDSDGLYDTKIDGDYYSWNPPQIELSDSGVTVSHKQNGADPTEQVQETDDATLDRIWELHKTLSGYDQEKADEVEEGLSNRSEALARDPNLAENAVARLEELIAERREDADEQEEMTV